MLRKRRRNDRSMVSKKSKEKRFLKKTGVISIVL